MWSRRSCGQGSVRPQGWELPGVWGRFWGESSVSPQSMAVPIQQNCESSSSGCSSQGHCMAEVGRDLWRSSGPTPLLKQGHPEPVAQDHEYLQGWRLHNHLGQPVPVLGHPHSEKVFPDVQKLLLCFSLCLLSCEGKWWVSWRKWYQEIREMKW